MTLFDAVAGRVGYEGFSSSRPSERPGNHVRTSMKPLPPEEVLFRRRGAPIRYEEDDSYAADRYLTHEQRLPDADLLKILHAYVSDFYSTFPTDDGDLDFKSFDETALLALGILLEEAAKDCTADALDSSACTGQND